jgi:hypothetical protein
MYAGHPRGSEDPHDRRRRVRAPLAKANARSATSVGSVHRCARDAAPSKGHLRAHHAGSQVEGSDAVCPPRPMRAPSYPCQCRPTGAVGAQLGPLSCAGAAVQVDNPSSPGCDHVRHHLARHQQRAVDVCGDDRPPLVNVSLPQRHLTLDRSGAVDQQVDPAPGRRHRPDRVAGSHRVGDVKPPRQSLARRQTRSRRQPQGRLIRRAPAGTRHSRRQPTRER